MKQGWLPSKAIQIYFLTNLFFLHPGWSAFAQESARPALDRRTTPPPCPRWTPPPCPPPPPRTCGTCGQCPTFPSPGWASPSPWGRGPGNGRATLTGSLLIFWISSIFSRQNFKSEHWFDPLHSLTDELLVKILAYLTSKELMGVARWRSSKYKLQHILLNNSISLGPRPTISKPIYQTTGAIPCIAFTTNDDFDPGCKAAQKFYRKKTKSPLRPPPKNLIQSRSIFGVALQPLRQPTRAVSLSPVSVPLSQVPQPLLLVGCTLQVLNMAAWNPVSVPWLSNSLTC